jgi:hypothetical protein
MMGLVLDEKNDLHPPVEQVMDAKEADYVC